MKQPMKRWKLLILLAACAYLYFIYYVVTIPAALDWSILGFVAVGVTLLLFFVALRPHERTPVFVLCGSFLLYTVSLHTLIPAHTFLPYGLAVVLFAGVSVIIRIWIRRGILSQLPIFLLAVTMVLAVNPDDAALLSHFTVEWKSQPLTNAFLEYPPYEIDPNTHQIITIRGKDKTTPKLETVKEGNRTVQRKLVPPLASESAHLVAFTWDHGQMKEQPVPNDAVLPPSFYWVNFPLFVNQWPVHPFEPSTSAEERFGQVLQTGTLPEATTHLIEQGINRVNVPPVVKTFENYNASIYDGTLRVQSPQGTLTVHTDATKVVGVGHLLDHASVEIVTVGDQISVYRIDGNRVTLINRTNDPYGFGQCDMMLGDIQGDGINELLLNKTPAQIWTFTPTGWKTLWTSPNTSFVFETVGQLDDSDRLIIANDKSQMRAEPTRYLTGYQWNGSGLDRVWRAMAPNFRFMTLADIDGDGQNELVGALYGSSTLYVLKPHGVPVTALLVASLYILLAILLLRRSQKASSAALMSVLAFMVAGCSIQPSAYINKFAVNLPSTGVAKPEYAPLIKEALAKTETAKSFGFQVSAYTQTAQQKLPETFQGEVDLTTHTVRLAETVLGNNYSYYMSGSKAFLYASGVWAPSKPYPVDMIQSLNYITSLQDPVTRLKDDPLFGRPFIVLQMTPTPEENQRILNVEQPIPGTWTFWIDPQDHHLAQWKSQLRIPLPQNGTIEEDTRVLIADINLLDNKVLAPAALVQDGYLPPSTPTDQNNQGTTTYVP